MHPDTRHPIKIRSYEEGDSGQILRLLDAVFGGTRNPALWHWRFRENPFQRATTGPPTVFASLAFDISGSEKLVGQYIVTPTFLNHVGLRLLGCQSGDTAVAPEYQGAGLFTATARDSYETLRVAGFKLVYGFPNLQSYPGFMRKLGWRRIFALNLFYRRLALGRLSLAPLVLAQSAIARIRLKRRFGSRQFEFRLCDDVPDEYGRLWPEVAAYEVFSLWKDRGYLVWRYQQHPEQRYRFFCLFEATRLVAIAVGTEHRGKLRLAELMALQKDPFIGMALVDNVVRWAIKAKLSSVELEAKDDGFFAAAFGGFSVGISSLVLCLRVFDDASLELQAVLPNNWSCTSGDLDFL